MKIKLFEKKAFLNAMVDTAVLALISFVIYLILIVIKCVLGGTIGIILIPVAIFLWYSVTQYKKYKGKKRYFFVSFTIIGEGANREGSACIPSLRNYPEHKKIKATLKENIGSECVINNIIELSEQDYNDFNKEKI